ncbi:MAG: hypothetical protein HOU81_10405 [Hamadaea sp.]|uniref:LppU/SCO3897 family protein n=1 Tax=Hamadaea sp. TaxID=2024425 RepID=UPI0017E0E616|nr:hypothetical protein [Hamadaea sp.]NUR71221.1 hypothetical protein [Hamadaea sp.]NUT17752.1 hypothetical protein [Hamadaea sp.]
MNGPNRPLMIVAGVLAVLGAAALTVVALTPDDGPVPPPAPTGTHIVTAGAVGARFARTGDCLVNEGSEADPVLRLVSCAPGAYAVLARFEGVTDADRVCAQVAGYEYNYSYDSPLDTELDFVLCLRPV